MCIRKNNGSQIPFTVLKEIKSFENLFTKLYRVIKFATNAKKE